MTIYKRAF